MGLQTVGCWPTLHLVAVEGGCVLIMAAAPAFSFCLLSFVNIPINHHLISCPVGFQFSMYISLVAGTLEPNLCGIVPG